MTLSDTTVHSRSPLISMPTEIQNAYNAFAVAVKNHTETPNKKTEKALEAAQAEVYRVEDLYREGRKLTLAHAIEQRNKTRQS